MKVFLYKGGTYMKQLLLPAGMKDLILDDVINRKQLQEQFETVFTNWGYDKVMTPTIEYYQTYQKGFGEIEEERMYKFFDRSGKIVVLKTDMTIPIARLAATKFRDAKLPLRMHYCEKVYKVNEILAGRYNEMSDCGVELIGADQSYDLEMIMLAKQALETLNNEKWMMEIGNISIFNEACTSLQLSESQKKKLANLIDEKQLPALQEYIETLAVEEQVKTFFLKLPWLSGDIQVLDEAMQYAYQDGIIKEIEKMKLLCMQLQSLGMCSFIVDLGKMNHLNYYTGIIFEAYIEGVGARILSGGRYDTLLEKFGKAMPAIGFSIKLDALLQAMPKVKQPKKIKIVYPTHLALQALQTRMQMEGVVQLEQDDNYDVISIQEVA